MHPGRARIKAPRTRRARETCPARSRSWRLHQAFGDPSPTRDRMNACSSRSILIAAIRDGRGAVYEMEVIHGLLIVTTIARIDTSCETDKNARAFLSWVRRPGRPRF